jgi:RHS repeat-associated protein
VAELDGTGTVVSQFVYGTRINVPDYMIQGGNTYRFITDQLGSPRFVIESGTATAIEHIDYDEFGNVLSDNNSGFQPFGFAGGLYDSDTGLVRFGARDYDPQTGHWITKDPIGFGGGEANLYGYAFNDPINFIDPAGKWAGVDELVGGLIGGAVNTGAYVLGQLIKYHGNIHCLDGGDLSVASGIGFVAGFFATDTFGASVALGASANTAQYAAIQAIHGRTITGTGLAANALTGALGGAAGSGMKAAESSTIDNIARGPSRYTSQINPIDKAIDAAPRGALAGYISNADPDCGCR